jgi:hypothetical protein
MNRHSSVSALVLAWALPLAAAEVSLAPASEAAGYLARLLINESPFPGERGYVSEEDSKATMRALLLVIDARRRDVPAGYTRSEIAETHSTNVIDIITAGGSRGQMAGFYRDGRGSPAMAARVTARANRRLHIARAGDPGRFSQLLSYAQSLASAYVAGAIPSPDPYAGITRIPPKKVTGRAYAWMTDQECYHPGGDFVRIPDRLRGRLGGNRFYTLAWRAAAPQARAAADVPFINLSKDQATP